MAMYPTMDQQRAFVLSLMIFYRPTIIEILNVVPFRPMYFLVCDGIPQLNDVLLDSALIGFQTKW